VLGISVVAGVRDHDRGDGLQLRDDLARVIEPTHMGVAGGENAIRCWTARIILNREEQFRHGFVEAPRSRAGQISDIYYRRARTISSRTA